MKLTEAIMNNISRELNESKDYSCIKNIVSTYGLSNDFEEFIKSKEPTSIVGRIDGRDPKVDIRFN